MKAHSFDPDCNWQTRLEAERVTAALHRARRESAVRILTIVAYIAWPFFTVVGLWFLGVLIEQAFTSF